MANAKPPSYLRAILWVAGGGFVGYIAFVGLLYLLDAIGMYRLLGSDVFGIAFWSFMIGGGLAGFASYRKSCRSSVSVPHLASPGKASSTEPLPKPIAPVEPSPQPQPKKTVFVSYRRDDSADVTGRIYDRLSSRFGSAGVFKDVDSIPLGRDFREVIDDAVAKASVVVVVIGKHWLGSESGADQPRIHDETDFVRAEVSTALRQGKPVIPVFVSNGRMPMDSQLPDDIKDITYRNGVNVRPDPDFAHDVERLIRGIEQA